MVNSRAMFDSAESEALVATRAVIRRNDGGCLS